MALIALERAKKRGLVGGKQVETRLRLGTEMLLDRACVGCGWNAGNAVVYGVPLRPHIDATAIALAALRIHYRHPIVRDSLAWLLDRVQCPSAYSLAWLILAAAAYHDVRADVIPAWTTARDRLAALVEDPRSIQDTSTIALAALALGVDSNQKQVVPPTPEEVWKLVDAGEEIGGPGRDMIFIDAFTGLRRNEILALQYTDVDWTNKELVINKAVSKTKVSDGIRKWEWRIGPPKSRKSNRRVAAAEAVLELLRRLRADAKDSSGQVFLGPGGKRMGPDYFDEFIFGRVSAHAGLPNVRFHDLRHFFASMLIAQGESAKYVCDQMGHSSIQVTFDTYGHLFPNSRATAAKKLQQAMFTGRKNGFGSSLVAKPRKRGKKKSSGENEG
jgi:integrase